EDGIRDFHVTGVQTCALPIFLLILAGFIAHAQDSAALAPAPVGIEETDPGYIPENPTLSGEERAETEFRNRSLKPDFKEDYRGRSEERRVGKECRARRWS